MKHASLLIALCLLFSLSAVAQSTAPKVDKTTVPKENKTKAPKADKTQRITITTKKVDDNGKTITETWIAEGDNPQDILKEMSISPEAMQQVEVDVTVDLISPDDETLFLFKPAGGNVIIEGTLDIDVDVSDENIFIIADNIEVKGDHNIKHIYTRSGNKDVHRAYAVARVGRSNSNCAALGVYANNRSDEYGAKINRIIENSGAQEAGLIEGDVIKKIDEFDVSDFQSLHFALANFLPGDEVRVDYMREGKFMHTKATLKNWSEIPGHEFRSRSDCGQPELSTEDSDKDLNVDKPTSINNVQALELADARVYPNPNDGIFALSFTPQPGPLSVTITDINGKEVYKDQMVNAGGQYNRDINIAEVPSGNYVITVTQGGKVYTHQISKQ
jgi:hypothetical protein